MGGGDLNTKKSWHPTNQKNQERVWKAEQKDAAEKKKLAQLQREIQEERDREELQAMARSNFEEDSNKKLDWMYKGRELNREEYLTGRSIDKNFEELSAQPTQQHPGIQVLKNHVEHEVVPFSIRQYKGLEATEQVDLARKIMEDPLMMIKQREIDNRRKILENPVRMKELHRMLKGDKTKKKSSKKEKKKKRSSSSGDDLDQILAEKYKKLQGVLQKDDSDDEGESNLDKILSTKYAALSQELDKMNKPKKKKKKSKSKRRSSSSSSNDFSVSKKRRSRSRSPLEKRQKSPPRHQNDRYQCTEQRRRSPERRRSPPRYQRADRNRSPITRRSRSPGPSRRRDKTPERKREKSPERRRDHHIPERKNNKNEKRSVSSGSPRPQKKPFGLIGADGKSLKLDMNRKRSRSPKYKPKVEAAKKAEVKRVNPSKLTEKEMQERLREMEQNANWREKERSDKVQRHREAVKNEEDTQREQFDKDFMNKQLKKTSNSMQSIESRIKSNVNNIQRSSRTMDTNFARR